MTFGEKMTVVAFKAKHNADKLQVVTNPKTGSDFVTANGKTVAAVSKNYDPTKDKEFVELVIEDGTIIWCLHNPSTANVKEEF